MWKKPLPDIDPDNVDLFESYTDHEFGLFRCTECGTWYFPKSGCLDHANEPYLQNITVEPASGRGEVFARTITHYVLHPGFEEDVPYLYALIKLEEGPLFASQIVDADPQSVAIETPVEVVFRDVPIEEVPEDERESIPFEDGFTLPYFTPTEAGAR